MARRAVTQEARSLAGGAGCPAGRASSWSVADNNPDPSPVPADRDLWPFELPFTAWGQYEHGCLDLRVFDQDVWWVDIAQRPHRLADMSEEYIANVIAFLEQNRDYFYAQTTRYRAVQMAGDLLLGRVPDEVVAGELGAPAHTELSPETWLNGTSLMRALRRRAAPPARGATP